jgi:regulator-associated protein of mTOR
MQNPYSMGEVSPEFVENIPGKDGDLKSPRGELSWIFTTVTDTIAWSTLPLPTFQKLFRQDLLVASLFRNFLLAKRVMKSLNCTPQSWPPLPDSTTHHLWQAWDLAAESCVLAAYSLFKGSSMVDPRNNMPMPALASSASTSFFSDHLTAFEVWLDFEASQSTLSLSTPPYLTVLLQMLLSPAHRLRALQLLRRYMSLGSHTVNLTLLVGIFPYVLKLLQNQSPDIRQVLLCIWTSIVGFDRSCRMELIRDKCQGYFVQYLLAKDLSSNHRCMAAFTLAEICNGTQEGRHSCSVLNLHGVCCAIV